MVVLDWSNGGRTWLIKNGEGVALPADAHAPILLSIQPGTSQPRSVVRSAPSPIAFRVTVISSPQCNTSSTQCVAKFAAAARRPAASRSRGAAPPSHHERAESASTAGV